MRIIEKTKQFFNFEKGKIKRNLLKLVLAVPFWIVVAAIGLIAFGTARAVYLTDTRPDQYVAETWQSKTDTAFRHMVVFAGGTRAKGDISPLTYEQGGKSIHLGDLPQIRQSLQASADTGLRSGSRNVPGSSKRLIGWEDCYSSTVKSTISPVNVVEGKRINGKATDVELVAVGGNYRAFHTFRFMSGGFLPEDPVDTFQIVINDVLAWKFFRSYDVTGHMVEIDGKLFTIIGVVEEKNTKVAELAGEQDSRAFIYFGALGTLYGGDSKNIPQSSNDDMGGGSYGDYEGGGGSSQSPSSTSTDYAIQCYEAMLPERVRGVAIADFKNAMPNYSLTNPQVLVVNDTGRFSVTRVIDTMFPIGETEMQRHGYEFPYWEVATQMTETRLFYDYVIIAAGILLGLIGAAALALKFRAKKAIAPEELELVVRGVEEVQLPEEEKALVLKEDETHLN